MTGKITRPAGRHALLLSSLGLHREVQLELDRVGNAENYRHTRLVDSEIRKGECSCRVSRQRIRCKLRVDLPGCRLRVSLHCEVADHVEGLRSRLWKWQGDSLH